MQSAELNIESHLHRKLNDDEPMITVMRSKRPLSLTIPKEYYGVDMNVSIVPLINEDGKVVGSLAVNSSIKTVWI